MAVSFLCCVLVLGFCKVGRTYRSPGLLAQLVKLGE
jgi:hypothetical protein